MNLEENGRAEVAIFFNVITSETRRQFAKITKNCFDFFALVNWVIRSKNAKAKKKKKKKKAIVIFLLVRIRDALQPCSGLSDQYNCRQNQCRPTFFFFFNTN